MVDGLEAAEGLVVLVEASDTCACAVCTRYGLGWLNLLLVPNVLRSPLS
jgi:hypothetical protein